MTPEIENIRYTALFVDLPERLIEMIAPRHANIKADHSTNRYRPTDLSGFELGRKSKLRIIGRAYDDKGDALLVDNPKSSNKFPHITLSCAEGVSPVYSNEMLENAAADHAIELFREPYVIDVTEGYCDTEGNIILSAE